MSILVNSSLVNHLGRSLLVISDILPHLWSPKVRIEGEHIYHHCQKPVVLLTPYTHNQQIFPTISPIESCPPYSAAQAQAGTQADPIDFLIIIYTAEVLV